MKKVFPQEFGLYAVLTDPLVGYEKITEILVEEEIQFIQLRIKEQTKEEILSIAKNLSSIIKNSKSIFIVNDDPEIAMLASADGVHVGQNDIKVSEVRKLVGQDLIIGLSTHSCLQVEQAELIKPDYIGMGPVYPTPTKKTPDPAIGLDGLKEMLFQSSLPAVAIGGINLENIHQVLSLGAKNFCAVRVIMQSNNPRKVIREFKNLG